MVKYWIVGGEYEATDFEALKPGTEEVREGPFADYADAYRKWQELSWKSVDSCNVRYRIEVENDAAA